MKKNLSINSQPILFFSNFPRPSNLNSKWEDKTGSWLRFLITRKKNNQLFSVVLSVNWKQFFWEWFKHVLSIKIKFVFCLLSSDDMSWNQQFERILIASDSFICVSALLSATIVIDNRFIIQINSPIWNQFAQFDYVSFHQIKELTIPI